MPTPDSILFIYVDQLTSLLWRQTQSCFLLFTTETTQTNANTVFKGPHIWPHNSIMSFVSATIASWPIIFIFLKILERKFGGSIYLFTQASRYSCYKSVVWLFLSQCPDLGKEPVMKADWEGSVPSEDLCWFSAHESKSWTGLGASVKDTISFSVLFRVLYYCKFNYYLPFSFFCNIWITDMYHRNRGGNSNPLQYSCLENSIDRGTWQATVHAVTEELETGQLTHTHITETL